MLTVLNVEVSSLASAGVDALKMGSGVKFGMSFMSFVCNFCQCEHIKDGCCCSVKSARLVWFWFPGGGGLFPCSDTAQPLGGAAALILDLLDSIPSPDVTRDQEVLPRVCDGQGRRT